MPISSEKFLNSRPSDIENDIKYPINTDEELKENMGNEFCLKIENGHKCIKKNNEQYGDCVDCIYKDKDGDICGDIGAQKIIIKKAPEKNKRQEQIAA